MTSLTQRFLFPVSTVSARNGWAHDSHLCAKHEGEKTAWILWVSLLTQARLIYIQYLPLIVFIALMLLEPSKLLKLVHKIAHIVVSDLFLNKTLAGCRMTGKLFYCCLLCHIHYLFVLQLIHEYNYLVYTKTMDSVCRALWLTTQSVNILHYSLIHLQFLRASDAKLA